MTPEATSRDRREPEDFGSMVPREAIHRALRAIFKDSDGLVPYGLRADRFLTALALDGFTVAAASRPSPSAAPEPRLIDTKPKIGALTETIELEIGLHNPGANWECDCGDQIAGETFNHHVAAMVDYRLTATDGDA